MSIYLDFLLFLLLCAVCGCLLPWPEWGMAVVIIMVAANLAMWGEKE